MRSWASGLVTTAVLDGEVSLVLDVGQAAGVLYLWPGSFQPSLFDERGEGTGVEQALKKKWLAGKIFRRADGVQGLFP
jgi:hypothetical protein